jgi:hypothetical protein
MTALKEGPDVEPGVLDAEPEVLDRGGPGRRSHVPNRPVTFWKARLNADN